MRKAVNPDVMESRHNRDELADEILAQVSKLEALCAVQALIASEGLAVPAKYQYSFALILETHARDLRQLLAHLLD